MSLFSSANRDRMTGRLFLRTLTLTALAVALSTSALAHKVNLFAYYEGDKIVVEGYFSKSRKAQDCEVVFSDAQGKTLHKGRTDDQGRFEVPMKELGPVKGDILITLIAGEGHKREYTLAAEEAPATSASSSKEGGEAQPDNKQTADVKAKEAQTVSASIGNTQALEQKIREIVKQENLSIIKMLGNQQRLLLEQENTGPSVRDVVGGIGWIFGIVGIIAFMSARNRKSSG